MSQDKLATENNESNPGNPGDATATDAARDLAMGAMLHEALVAQAPGERAAALLLAFGFRPDHPIDADKALPWDERTRRCAARRPHTVRALQLAWRAIDLARAVYLSHPDASDWERVVSDLERAYVAAAGLGHEDKVVWRVRIYAALDNDARSVYEQCVVLRAAARKRQGLPPTPREKKALATAEKERPDLLRHAADPKHGPSYANYDPASHAADALIARLQAVLPGHAKRLKKLHKGAAKAITAWMAGKSKWIALNAELLKPLGLAVGSPNSLKVEWSAWQRQAREHPLFPDKPER